MNATRAAGLLVLSGLWRPEQAYAGRKVAEPICASPGLRLQSVLVLDGDNEEPEAACGHSGADGYTVRLHSAGSTVWHRPLHVAEWGDVCRMPSKASLYTYTMMPSASTDVVSTQSSGAFALAYPSGSHAIWADLDGRAVVVSAHRGALSVDGIEISAVEADAVVLHAGSMKGTADVVLWSRPVAGGKEVRAIVLRGAPSRSRRHPQLLFRVARYGRTAVVSGDRDVWTVSDGPEGRSLVVRRFVRSGNRLEPATEATLDVGAALGVDLTSKVTTFDTARTAADDGIYVVASAASPDSAWGAITLYRIPRYGEPSVWSTHAGDLVKAFSAAFVPSHGVCVAWSDASWAAPVPEPPPGFTIIDGGTHQLEGAYLSCFRDPGGAFLAAAGEEGASERPR